MKKIYLLLLVIFIFASNLSSQWTTKWKEVYATYDDEINGTGDNTIDVAVLREDKFVALCSQRNVTCYLIPYLNADSANGRKQFYGYSPATDGFYQKWASGFDEVYLKNAWQVAVGPDSLIYVANNDSLHNILVFSFKDTIESADFRIETGAEGINAIHVDKNGYVYVLNDTTYAKTNDLKIYPPKNQWRADRKTLPIITMDLPDGIYKGVATSNNGKVLFIGDYLNRKVYRYDGSPTAGYFKTNTFSFSTSSGDSVVTSTGIDTAYVLGLGFYDKNGLLFVACSKLFGGSQWYKYGRIYMLSAKTGAVLDTIDQAKWNFLLTGGYQLRSNGTSPGNASGYTSTYGVDVDEKGNLYSQSFYGWTVEKWKYDGTLPTILKVEKNNDLTPQDFSLEQNYPNPFNPTTIINFSIPNNSKTTLIIYNSLGKEVANLVNEFLQSGNYSVTFDSKNYNLASGLYFYKLTTGEFAETKKMILLK